MEEKHKSYAFFLVNLAVFLDTLLYGIIVPVIPHYATTLGISTIWLGFIFAAYSAGLLLAGVPSGMACDRFGYRPVMVGGALGLTLATIAFAFSRSAWILAASRFVQGVAAAATWSAGLALVAILYPPQVRGQKMGVAMASTGLGTILGPPVGGALYQWAGYASPFLLTAVLGLLLTLLLWCGSWPKNRPSRPRGRFSWAGLLAGPNILLATAITLAGSFGYGMLEPTLPLHLHESFDLDSARVGLFFGLFSVTYSLCQPLVGALADRLGRKPLIFAGLLAEAALLPWLALAKTPAAEASVMALLGFAVGTCSTPLLPLLADSAEKLLSGNPGIKEEAAPRDSPYGTAFGLTNTVYSLGLVLGPPVGTALLQQHGFTPVAFTHGAIMGAAALAVAAYMREPLAK